MNTPAHSDSLGDAAMHGGEVPGFELPEEDDDGTTSGTNHRRAEVDTSYRSSSALNAAPKITQASPVAPPGNPESAGDVGAVRGGDVVELEAGAVVLSTGRTPVATSGKSEKPPRPTVPTGVQAECEWRQAQHKSGCSFTLLFRPYVMEDGKKKRLKSDYVFYISVGQWEKLKQYDSEKRKNYVQADFNYWWEANKAGNARTSD